MSGPWSQTADGFVAPAYGGRSLTDVMPAIAGAVGAGEAFRDELDGVTLELPEAPAYVLLLVDGLGDTLLRAHPDDAPFLSSLPYAGDGPATVGVPSTTATSLTSLGTALAPATHGVVGFTSRIPGTGKLLNALTWSKDVDAHAWQPHRTAFDRLAAAGVRTTTVNKREFGGSGLTVASTRGAVYVGVDKMGERLVAVEQASAPDGGAPAVVYTYDGDLDWTGHRYGVDSEQWRTQLAMSDLAAEQLREALPDTTRVLVVADHGMVDPRPEDRVDIDDHPELTEGVALVGGEARFRHLYCRVGADDDVVATWRSTLGDRVQVLRREEALALGWFGASDAQMLPRIGDVVVACRGTTALLTTAGFPYETKLVGMHGSLTPDEMLVPVLVA